jgi:Transposase DDE domain
MPATRTGSGFSTTTPRAAAVLRPRRSLGSSERGEHPEGWGFYGYKLHLAACTRTGLPLVWQLETARRHESPYVARSSTPLHARGFRPATCAMDKGYDNSRRHRRVRIHADLTMLARLGQALARARAVPLAA